MAVSRPSAADIDAATKHFGFHLDADAQRDYLAVVGHMLNSYDVVDELYDESVRPQAPNAPTASRSPATTRWVPGTSPLRSPPAPRGRYRAGQWRSRTTSPSPAFR